MAENSLCINHDAGSIQLFWQRGNSMPRLAPAVTFEHPFDSKVLAELRGGWRILKGVREGFSSLPSSTVRG